MIKEMQDPWQTNQFVRRGFSKFREYARSFRNRIFPRKVSPAFLPPLMGYDDGQYATTPGSKRVLMIYVIAPFYQSTPQSRIFHSNQEQTIEIYRAFRRLGYAVDIVDYRDSTFIPSADYNVFFGMGENAGKIAFNLRPETFKIYYGTGEYWEYEKQAEQTRRDYLRVRRGVSLPSFKFPSKNEWASTANALILICNQHTAGTYPNIFRKVYTIDNSVVSGISAPVLANKNFTDAQKNFVFMGSSHLLRRGLDIALEAFASMPDMHLWVCGPLDRMVELDFIKAYRKELFQCPNIHPIGWMDVLSETFREITDCCAGFINPSCTESMAGSALNCMRRGLIPLVSRDVGVDIKEDFGFIFEHDTVDCIRDTVRHFSKLGKDHIRHMSEQVLVEVDKRYTLDTFAHNIESILSELLYQR